MDQLSSGVWMSMPSPYRSPRIRPLYVTTSPSVRASGGPKPASIACSTRFMSSVFRPRVVRKDVTHRPGCRRRRRQVGLDDRGLEAYGVFADGVGHTTLAAVAARGAHDTVRKGQRDHLPLDIDHPVGDVVALIEGRDEAADVGGGVVRLEAGDEHGRAEDLREAGRVVVEGLSRRRNVLRVELERRGASDQLLG